MKTTISTIAILIGASFALCDPTEANNAPDKTMQQQIDQVFAEYSKAESPGCALGVYRDHAMWYQQGYGLASLEHRVPIAPQHTVFDIGSTSKQFMAASILLLEQDGKLKTTDDIRQYLPEMPDYGYRITIDHLIHHTSGIRDYITLLMMTDIKIEDHTSDTQALHMIARQSALDFVPGTEFSYSNSGYFLLSQIVQRVSGKTWVEFADERLFKPLSMLDSQVLNNHKKVIGHRATAYETLGENQFAVQMSNWEQTGDGAVQTTVADLLKWDTNFYQPKVGGKKLIDELYRTTTLQSGDKVKHDYARGLHHTVIHGMPAVQHGGAWAGYRAELIRIPEQKFSVAVLCNVALSNPTMLARQVIDVVLADKIQSAVAASPANEATAIMPSTVGEGAVIANVDQYVGMYWNQKDGLVRTLEVRDGKLFYVRGEGRENELAQSTGTSLRMLGTSRPITLAFEQRGSDRIMVFDPEGDRGEYIKVTPAAPSVASLKSLAGRYYSQELDTTWTLVYDNNALQLQQVRDANQTLAPKFIDAFFSKGMLLRVKRDSKMRVTGFVVDAGRAREIGFNRVSP